MVYRISRLRKFAYGAQNVVIIFVNYTLNYTSCTKKNLGFLRLIFLYSVAMFGHKKCKLLNSICID